jgi:membrane-associated phospholipid phosphatase
MAWGGPGRPVEAIQGEKWIAYNPGSNPTPAFPGYVSGHSAFSSASATVLQLITGSDRFDYRVTIPANFGRVEPGVPAVPTVIAYKKFSDAVYDAGMSRLYGGIHFKDDNTAGQLVGAAVGQWVYAKVKALFNDSADD